MLKKHWMLITLTIVLVIILALLIWVFMNVKETVQEGIKYDFAVRAETAMEEGKYAEAFELLQKAQQVDPSNKNYTLLQADAAFLYGEYQVASTLYKQFPDQSFAEVYYIEALKQLSQANVDTAITQLDEALQQTSGERPLTKDEVTKFTQGVQNLKAEQNKSLLNAKIAKLLIENNAPNYAEVVLSSLLEKEPGYRDGHYLMGAVYYQQGKNDLARESLNKALEIDPNYAPARELLNQVP